VNAAVSAESSTHESSVQVRTVADGDAWSWTLRARPAPKLGNVRLADWDAEGKCLAATTRGLFFWDGADWCSAKHDLDHLAVRIVRSVGVGRWVVGSNDACHLYGFGEMSLLWQRAGVSFEHFDGALDGIALVGGRASSGATMLRGCVRGHWLRPLTLTGVAMLTSLSRVDEDRWLVTGHTDAAKPFAAIVAPLASSMKVLRTGGLRAFAASAGRTELGIGCAVGSGGALVCDHAASAVDAAPAADLTAVAIDPIGRVVVTMPGRILLGSGALASAWRVIWRDDGSRRPIASLFANTGVVRALVNDTAILEGRLRGASDSAPLETAAPAEPRELTSVGSDEDDYEATLPGRAITTFTSGSR